MGVRPGALQEQAGAPDAASVGLKTGQTPAVREAPPCGGIRGFLSASYAASWPKAARSPLSWSEPSPLGDDSASFDDAVLSGEEVLAQSWSGQIAKIMKEAPWVRSTTPKEGAMVFVDNLAIPRNAPHADLAHEFLDFVMEPHNRGRDRSDHGLLNPIPVWRELLPAEVRGNPAMFPGDAQMKQLRAFEDLVAAPTLHDRLWTEVKSAR